MFVIKEPVVLRDRGLEPGQPLQGLLHCSRSLQNCNRKCPRCDHDASRCIGVNLSRYVSLSHTHMCGHTMRSSQDRPTRSQEG
eukprot:jgi/Botrbrau1/10678/Bobra.139_2s0008.1